MGEAISLKETAMKNLRFVVPALGLLVLSGCATYDRVAVTDYRVTQTARVAALSGPDATPGAGGVGGAGAGAARR
jgi:hypothetical protein